MYIAEVYRDGDSLGVTLDHMKNWLDLHGYEPKVIRASLATGAVVFRVVFEVESEALAFAGAFSGQVLSELAA
jgi:hypothetical protein